MGINKNIVWYTFRHSFGKVPKTHGKDVKTVQEFLRHANSGVTLGVYTQAVNSQHPCKLNMPRLRSMLVSGSALD